MSSEGICFSESTEGDQLIKTHRIAVIAGDGIGPEVIKEGIKVLQHIEAVDADVQFEFERFPWGCEYYLQTGQMMAENGLKELMKFDAIYLGAVGAPGVPDHISLWDLLLKIRKAFDQYINLRPVKLLDGAPTPLKTANRDTVDMLVIRENSEGEYAGIGDRLFQGKPEEVVLQTAVFSRKGTERVIRYAFEIAKKTGQSVTSISKANALNYSMVFWDEVFVEISKEYPDVETSSYLVDAASMFFVMQPERFEVVVTSNLFGDILTDLGAALAGGLGLSAGANINPERTYPSMFEPVHGSAPDIAGKGLANPLAAVWSASQLMDHLGYTHWGERILKAMENVMVAGQVLTPDMNGQASTVEVGDEVIRQLQMIK